MTLENAKEASAKDVGHVSKKRKLRPPGAEFSSSSGPTDNPDLHKGRKRTVPHIEGQWSTHIYIEPKAPPQLIQCLKDVADKAIGVLLRDCNIEAHSLLAGEDSKEQSNDLHMSLSRPIQLWSGQKTDFLKACRTALVDISGFQISFANLAILTNDELTRSFLVCEVGYGFDELCTLTTTINEVLKARHLPKYYAEPRFHVSIAWWLHDEKRTLDEKHLATLEADFSESRQHILVVDGANVKIGKEATRIKLEWLHSGGAECG